MIGSQAAITEGTGPCITEEELIMMAAALGHEMVRLGGRVVTVESCTGGLVARLLTETGGSSAWFDRGFVTYTNEAKMDLVGVRQATLQTHGAVSEAVAREMAAGGLSHSRASLSLAVTGIAGPGGAVERKPVGTVCFGWALNLPGGDAQPLIVSEQGHFPGDRSAVRRQSAGYALQQAMRLVHQRLQEQPPVV